MILNYNRILVLLLVNDRLGGVNGPQLHLGPLTTEDIIS